MFNRMCWNSRGWRLPTGTSGDGGYPSKMGFGHEEWNFQIADAVDGFVYGYLYYNPAEKIMRESGGHFRIGFWSIHPDTREKLLVGMYNDATLPTDDDYKKLDKAFSQRKIYERRIEELRAAVDSISEETAYYEVTNSVLQRWLNFKCSIEKVQYLSEYVPVQDVIKDKTLGQYFTRPTFVSENSLPVYPRRLTKSGHKKLHKRHSSTLAEDAYYRESAKNLKRIIRRHNKLSNKFAAWLKDAGYSNISQEQNYVDVSFQKADTIYIAELKTCYGVGTTKSIREALGQLLEYNYYPGRQVADQWVIILDEKVSRDDIEYIRILKKKHNLPVSLGWYDGIGFCFADGSTL